MKRVRFRVAGRVQGVGYRRFAEASAIANGLAGFVRNEPDGRVTGEAEGEDGALARFLDDLRAGPTFARVDAVEVDEVPATGERTFGVRR